MSTSETMKLFVGVCFADPQQQRLLQKLRDSSLTCASWEPARNYHITLLYLGDVPCEKADEIHAALAAIEHTSFEVFLEEVDIFNDCSQQGHPPYSIHVRVHGDTGLCSLYKRICTALKPLDFKPQHDTYIPHITLARLKNTAGREDVSDYLNSHPRHHEHQFRVNTFHLFQSLPTSGGKRPEYRKVNTYLLQEPESLD